MNIYGMALQKRLKQSKPLRYLTGIEEWDYGDFCNKVNNKGQSFIEKIVDCAFNGKLIILRDTIGASKITKITTKIHERGKMLELSDSSAEMLDGIGNIHYLSNPSLFQNGYKTLDHSYYFFPWNGYPDILEELIEKVSITKVINGYDEKFHKNIPSDGVIERLHVIHYPTGGGTISEHHDPYNLSWFNCAIYCTEFGKDYHEGGFFMREAGTKNKIHLDSKVNIGDMVFFFPGLFHGVDPIDPLDKVDFGSKKGRWFANYNLLESHHVKGRQSAIAHEPS